MDAVKFLKELKRLCHFDKSGWCDECPMKDCCLSEEAPMFWRDEIIALAIPIVEKWSAEHPRKTRLQDFLEKYPGVPKRENGCPFIFPVDLGYCAPRKTCGDCENYRRLRDINSLALHCWNLPLEG